MTNQEILEKAILKAIDGGWLPYFARFDKHMNKTTIRFIITEGSNDIRFEVVTKGRIYGVSGYTIEIPSIIFNHDFAKALWGDEPIEPDNYEAASDFGQYEFIPKWQHYLQQMVVASDPIKYLGDHLDD